MREEPELNGPIATAPSARPSRGATRSQGHGVCDRYGAVVLAWLTCVGLATGVAFAQVESAAPEGGGGPPSIMQVEPGLMIWTVITFVLLLVLLRFSAWGPLKKSLDAREKRIRDAVEGAERARQDSEELLQRHRQMIDAAQHDAAKILEEGKAAGLRLKHELNHQARAEAEEMKARVRRELELATDQAKKELWDHATQLSTELAERILERSLNSADESRLIAQVVKEYRSVGTKSAN